jgi:hypothetical protein
LGIKKFKTDYIPNETLEAYFLAKGTKMSKKTLEQAS